MSQSDLEIISKIAGDIIISDNPGQMLKIWRRRLKIKQIILAKQMKISPSVLSDYESGRRSSPGIVFIKKYIKALVEIDKTNNKTLNRLLKEEHSAIIGIGEFNKPVTALELKTLLKAIQTNNEAQAATNIQKLRNKISGAIIFTR